MESTVDMSYKRNRIHPQKFALWVGIASMVMFFGGLTSAFIVRQAAGNWLEFPMPSNFYVSTVLVVLGSIALHLSYAAYKKQKESQYKYLLLISLALSVAFLVSQYMGWQELYKMGIDFKGNVSGSFTYLITGAHALHVLGGIAALIVAAVHAFTLKFEYKEFRKNRFELVLHYWHFLGFLWIYLFFFLLNTK